MIEKIKISAVSYLNSKPFIYGIENSKFVTDYELSLDIPSICAQKLLSGEIDLGLVPAIIISKLKSPFIISDYCIGAHGAVNSVMLYSDVPLNEIENVLLDYQSETSVMLARVLAAKHWNISPQWINAEKDYEANIKDKTAGVVIGDRTFSLNSKFKYKWDLSEEWYNYTQLPFVFACWVSNKKLPDIFISEFNNALRFGIGHIDKAIEEMSLDKLYQTDVKNYLTNYISYPLDGEKKKGLERFLEEAKKSLTQMSFRPQGEIFEF